MGSFVTCAVHEKLLGRMKEDEGVGACSTQVDIYRIFCGKLAGRRHMGTPMRKLEGTIKIRARECGVTSFILG